LVGRERDVAELAARLQQPNVHLLTLTGAPGSGKTRFAVALATELLDQFADGVAFVPLAAIPRPDLVATTIAQALGVRAVAGQPIEACRQHALRDQQVLLVLDNFEHLLSAAPLVADLLAWCPPLTVLVTGRAPLRLRGEQEFSVAPLSVPAFPDGPRDERHGPLALDIGALAASPAVQLFVERVRDVQPHFALSDANAADVAAICIRLDGLPLAIELAAARSRLFPGHHIRDRLAARLPFLTAGPRDLPARQQTLRAAIAWSVELLDPYTQSVFNRLGAFAGEWTQAGLTAVCTSDGGSKDDGAVEQSLGALVDHSLVQRVEHGTSAGEPRYGMLETIREYAVEQLAATGQLGATRDAHARYFLGLAEQVERTLEGKDQAAGMRRLDAELPNLRTALAWCLEQPSGAVGAEHGLRLAAAIVNYWRWRSLLHEGRRWLEAGLAVSNIAPAVRVKALHAVGFLAYRMGDLQRTAAAAEECIGLCGSLGDEAGMARSLYRLGVVAAERRDDAAAQTYFDDSFARWRRLGDPRGILTVVIALGEEARRRGDYTVAAARGDEAVARAREAGGPADLGMAVMNRGWVALRQGETRRAAMLLAEALSLWHGMTAPGGVGLALAGIAGVATARGRADFAARLLGAADALMRPSGFDPGMADRRDIEREQAAARAALGEETYAACWAAGQALDPEDVVAEALELAQAEPAPPSPESPRCSPLPDDLSPREAEVLGLVATGRSNREIAELLVLSTRTVERHIANVYGKIGAHGKSARMRRRLRPAPRAQPGTG
jgi:non-specific serine/threonine protein kinase